VSGNDASQTTPAPSAVPPETISVLVETERLLKAGQYAEAVTFAYLSVVQDVIQAFGLRPPKQWTHREFLTWGIRPDMGYFTSLLPRIYSLYEPVRYGEARDWRRDDLLGILRLVYAEEPMRRLYGSPGVPTFSAMAGRAPPLPSTPRPTPGAEPRESDS
jgi:hypothetical protein